MKKKKVRNARFKAPFKHLVEKYFAPDTNNEIREKIKNELNRRQEEIANFLTLTKAA